MTSGLGPSRRERILAAAEAEFAEHGYAGARVARIAEAAAVNKQLLFHYFESKRGLHRAVSDAVASRSAVSAPTGRTPAERLRVVIGELVTASIESGDLLPDSWRTQAAALIAGIIEDGQRSGHFRDDVDPSAISEVVVAAAVGARTTRVSDKRAGAHPSVLAGSLTQMLLDHATWR